MATKLPRCINGKVVTYEINIFVQIRTHTHIFTQEDRKTFSKDSWRCVLNLFMTPTKWFSPSVVLLIRFIFLLLWNCQLSAACSNLHFFTFCNFLSAVVSFFFIRMQNLNISQFLFGSLFLLLSCYCNNKIQIHSVVWDWTNRNE